MLNDSNIHGSVFLLLENYVNGFGEGVWKSLINAAGLSGRIYSGRENYPLTEMQSILVEASRATGLQESDLKEQFGEKLVPALLAMYKNYLNPEWKTFELLEFTEHVMHKAVRKEESKANPPVLNVARVHDKLIIIDYYSKRKMGSLAVGIVRGISKYYNESDRVKVIPMTNPNEERVQIRVEFD